MIAILDYDAGNIKSVEKAMQLLGQEVRITRDKETILSADKVILPGVGAFGDAMGKIRQYGLDEVIHEVVHKGTPFLGICLGLKLQNNGRLFKKLPSEAYVYFVHSYYLKAADESIVTAVTEYGTQIHASVESGNVFACQFHPEKSSDVGIQILRNFISI